ncbi:hypothetical protein [Lactococcus allomyrinae]|uniref:Uncharacterized protein n=1 Tax=Lactococcus allomyrinae TaxID=2419773 RepID=A0A387BHF7_9LACT|nr:hypothetical protein [Lactococcus allomyrinae]AYG00457.1 hypothetical protein D7I46_04755 [Lactococcus allomyrinae]
MTIILIVLFLILIFAMTGLIVYFSISRAMRENKKYEQFAKSHGYQFDKAQGQLSYRESSKTSKTGMIVNLKLFRNPFVERYANYQTYPFGRGADIKVAYVISGIYEGIEFRAFTYIFTGSTFDSLGRGGVFSIVMIKCEKELTKKLPENIFFEGATLCSYLQGNLEVDTIHSRIEKLKGIEGE